ncbi:MAG TPA: hypothetical protein VFM77_17025 [Terriglobales bacterium]|nr:hypothetical protein [Terriglobales bacterium]
MATQTANHLTAKIAKHAKKQQRPIRSLHLSRVAFAHFAISAVDV